MSKHYCLDLRQHNLSIQPADQVAFENEIRIHAYSTDGEEEERKGKK